MERTPSYQVVSSITEEEANDLAEFLGSRYDTTVLTDLVMNKTEMVDTVYRGIKFRKRDLKIGNTYEHGYPLSSWSLNKEIAIGFALDDYVPEGFLDEMAEEKGYNPDTLPHKSPIWTELYQEFANIVLISKAETGFVVNHHLLHNHYSKEEEVIMYMGKWVIADIQQVVRKNAIEYFEVTVEKIRERCVA